MPGRAPSLREVARRHQDRQGGRQQEEELEEGGEAVDGHEAAGGRHVLAGERHERGGGGRQAGQREPGDDAVLRPRQERVGEQHDEAHPGEDDLRQQVPQVGGREAQEPGWHHWPPVGVAAVVRLAGGFGAASAGLARRRHAAGRHGVSRGAWPGTSAGTVPAGEEPSLQGATVNGEVGCALSQSALAVRPA